MVENPADMDQWDRALTARFVPDTPLRPFTRQDWDRLLGHVGGITDYPAVVFVRELVETYPEANVVLIERDVDRWYESFNDSVIKGAAHPLVPILRVVDPGFVGKLGKLLDLVTRYYFQVQDPRDLEAWRRNARQTYLRHNDFVKTVTPEERLLLFRIEQGWEPLCKFLGKEVPDVPFPKVNEMKDVDEKAAAILQRSIRCALLSWAKLLAPVVVAGTAALWAVRRSIRDG